MQHWLREDAAVTNFGILRLLDVVLLQLHDLAAPKAWLG